jgi:hypothetical protein
MAGPNFFRGLWRLTQAVLVISLLAAILGAINEYSLRRYLRGFSDAVVPLTAAPEQKVEAILTWMRAGPARRPNTPDEFMANRDPQDTLNYGQLLQVCGTATNAFLNLAASGGIPARRLLLIGPDRGAKHVVAEVRINGRWVVADPSLRILFRDAAGHTVTRQQLQDPAVLHFVTRGIPEYPASYTYDKTSHIHLSRIPVVGKLLRSALDEVSPGWDESVNWTMPLERKSYGLTLLALLLAGFCMLLNAVLTWYARSHFGFEGVGVREYLRRFGRAFSSIQT